MTPITLLSFRTRTLNPRGGEQKLHREEKRRRRKASMVGELELKGGEGQPSHRRKEATRSSGQLPGVGCAKCAWLERRRRESWKLGDVLANRRLGLLELVMMMLPMVARSTSRCSQGLSYGAKSAGRLLNRGPSVWWGSALVPHRCNMEVGGEHSC